MKRLRALLWLLLPLPLCAAGPIRVLIVDGYSNHDWRQTTALIRGFLEPTGLFAITVSTAPPTTDAPGWESVSDLYRVLGELRVLTDRLPQAFDQLARHLQRPVGEGSAYKSDANTSITPEDLVAAAVVALEEAEAHLRKAAEAANSAQSAVSHLST